MNIIRKYIYIIVALAATASLAACQDDDFVAPAFLHIDAIVVDTTADAQITTGFNETRRPGFTRSDIPFCNVYAYYTGGRKAEFLGHFEMPFTIPVLSDSDIDSLEVYPAIAQSGIYGTQPAYPFLDRICIKKKNPTDTLRFVPGDTLRFDTLHTAYDMRYITLHLFEHFEHYEGLAFDSVITWNTNAPDEACSGSGYGSVTVPDSFSYVDFAIKKTFTVPYTAYTNLYLELDTRSDIPFEIYMTAAYTTGGSEDTRGIVMVNPSSDWKHLYINLGRTWSWFNHPSSLKISFSALNEDGTGGTVRLDNVKLMSTTKMFL